jgi:hypothetical protein
MVDIAGMTGGGAMDRVDVTHRTKDGDIVLGIVRASSWGDLFDCGYRWYHKEILGMRLPSRGGAVVGSAIHKGSAVFDKAVLDGRIASVDEAVAAAADYARAPVRDDGSPQEVDWNDDDDSEKITRDGAVDFSVKLTAKYCQTVAPDMRYEAIEVKCHALNIKTSMGVVRLTGTTDRVRVYDDETKGIADFKSGQKAVEGITSGAPRAVTKGHHLQLGVYTLMTEAETKARLTGPASIIGFQVNSKLHIATGEVANPKRALLGQGKAPGMIEIAAAMLKTGVFPPNPKSVLCSKKWCAAWGVCTYHE